jgi:protein-S-isoprenylcysteine O-methyltransferase Ste14
MEKLIGPKALSKCNTYRIISSILQYIAIINYIFYYSNPLPLPLPKAFPWTRWISICIAAIIFIVSIWLMFSSVKSADKAKKEFKNKQYMPPGIFRYIRYPQTSGELLLWWAIAFFLNSPFLVLFSFLYIPIYLSISHTKDIEMLHRKGDTFVDYYNRTGGIFPRL